MKDVWLIPWGLDSSDKDSNNECREVSRSRSSRLRASQGEGLNGLQHQSKMYVPTRVADKVQWQKRIWCYHHRDRYNQSAAEIKNDGRWPEKTPLKANQTAVCRTARTVVWEERERKPNAHAPRPTRFALMGYAAIPKLFQKNVNLFIIFFFL